MSMQIVFEQILIIFGYVIVGYVAGKKNLITKEQQRYLSKLVSSLILPLQCCQQAAWRQVDKI